MVALLPFWVDAGSYYYVVFLVLAMLGSRVPGVTPLLLAASALTSLSPLLSGRMDPRSYFIAAVIVTLLAAATVVLARLATKRRNGDRSISKV